LSHQSDVPGAGQTITAGFTRFEMDESAHITETYWQIGHDIVEFEQGAKLGPNTARRFWQA